MGSEVHNIGQAVPLRRRLLELAEAFLFSSEAMLVLLCQVLTGVLIVFLEVDDMNKEVRT